MQTCKHLYFPLTFGALDLDREGDTLSVTLRGVSAETVSMHARRKKKARNEINKTKERKK
jgi:hypothetical protein